MQPEDRHPLRNEYQLFALLKRHRRERHERSDQKVLPRVRVRAAADERDEVKIVDDHCLVLLERPAKHPVDGLVQRQWIAFRRGLDELTRRQKGAAGLRVEGAQDACLADAAVPGENGDLVAGELTLECVESDLRVGDSAAFPS